MLGTLRFAQPTALAFLRGQDRGGRRDQGDHRRDGVSGLVFAHHRVNPM
ncbi:MAG: hypothetical protein Q8Q28_00040 [Pseudomonadota bacterium]|nr:hypothetical protein [Pseudomonadota bacterium]